MRVIVVFFAIIGALVALLANPLYGLAFAIIPFIFYMAKHCFDVTENQKEMIRILNKISEDL